MDRLVEPLRAVRQAGAIAAIAARSAWLGLLEFYESDSLMYAASIAYYSLLSLFPFFMIAFSVIGLVTADPEDRGTALRFIDAYFPAQFDFIENQLDAFRTHSVSLGIVGTLALVWGAISVFGAIGNAVNYAWGVKKRRNVFHHRLFSAMMMLLAAALVTLVVLLVSASHMVEARWFEVVVTQFPALMFLSGFVTQWATTLLFIVVVGLIFYYVPNVKVPFRDVWVGAFVTGLLWKAALEMISWYASDLTRLSRINGSITAVVVFLLWVYVQATILLYGAQFTAVYARLRGDRLIPEPDDE
jgi:membrane protein